MNLSDYISEIFNQDNFKTAKSIKYSKEHPWNKLFTKTIPFCLKEMVNELETAPIKNNYEYEGSIGVGKLADVFLVRM